MKPRLIHFHTATLAASMRWLSEELAVPYTLSVRGSDVQVAPLVSAESACSIAEAIRGATGVHAVCRALGQEACRLACSSVPVSTIYTTVDVPQCLPSYRPSDSDNLHLVTVGRIDWRKGLSDLLRALSRLRDAGAAACLTLVGTGPDEARVRHWAGRLGLQGQVHFAGKCPPAAVREFLARAHAYVQSSLAEGFSNSTAEALAVGAPVFATDVGGTSELIRDGENGFLLPPLRPECWADKLQLAQDKVLMARLRVAAYETARYAFSPSAHARQFIEFYRQASSKCDTARRNGQRTALGQIGALEPATGQGGTRTIHICGRWQWESGADLALRAVARAARAQRHGEGDDIRIVIQGCGPQEDELRYLAQFLGFSPQNVVFAPPVNEQYHSSAETRVSDVLVRLPEQATGCWEVWGKSGSPVPVSFGRVDQLSAVVEEALGK